MTASEKWDLSDKMWMNLENRTDQTGDEDHKLLMLSGGDKSFQLSEEREDKRVHRAGRWV